MKTIQNILIASALLAGISQAQTVLVPTTLSSALTKSGRTVVVASATNCVAGGPLYVGRELMTINSISSTTMQVTRGAGGTTSGSHASAAMAWCGPAGGDSITGGIFSSPVEPTGSCTRSNYVILPLLNVRTGLISDCVGGSFLTGVRGGTPFHVLSPNTGNVAYTAINTNGTTLGATTLYCSEVFLPANKLLTGIALLNGTTVGTDNHYVVLYDSAGNALANSALAGAVAASASAYQEFAFTSKFYAVGPSQYFACFQTNGTTATVRMGVTGLADNYLTKGQTGATFGTVPALTVPTSFTSVVGPFIYLY